MKKFDELYNKIITEEFNPNFKMFFKKSSVEERNNYLSEEFMFEYIDEKNLKKIKLLKESDKDTILKEIKNMFLSFYNTENIKFHTSLDHFCINEENDKKLQDCFKQFGKYTVSTNFIDNTLYIIFTFRPTTKIKDMVRPFISRGDVLPKKENEAFVNRLNQLLDEKLTKIIHSYEDETYENVSGFDKLLNELKENKLSGLFSIKEGFDKLDLYKSIINKYSDEVKKAYLAYLRTQDTGARELLYTDYNEPWTKEKIKRKEDMKDEMIEFVTSLITDND